MRAPPNTPHKHITIGKTIDLGGSPSLKDIFAATNEIVAAFPDVEMSEIQMVYDEGYDNFDSDSDLGGNYYLVLVRTIPNPNYQSEFAKYESDMREFEREVAEERLAEGRRRHKEIGERQRRRDATKVRQEWKADQRIMRLKRAGILAPDTNKSCND